MHIKTFFKNLKKRASGSVETAIKVLTAVVLGAAILMGLYGLVTGVVLPSTETAVSSMFAYSAEANGGSGTETPTPTPTPATVSFAITFIDMDSTEVTMNYEVEEGTTWGEWLNSNPEMPDFTPCSGDSLIHISAGDDGWTEGELVCGIVGMGVSESDPITNGTYQAINQ